MTIVQIQAQGMWQGMNHPSNAQGWAMQSISTFDSKGVAIPLNPAAVARSPQIVKFNYTNFLHDINSTDISYISSQNNYELSLKYLNFGEFTERTPENEILGKYTVSDIYSRFSWGTQIIEDLYGGMNLHYGYSRFHQEKAKYLTSGAGLLYIYNSEITIGLSTINQSITGQSYDKDFEEPPLNYIILGASKKLAHMPMRIGLDVIRNSDDEYYANLGGHINNKNFNVYWGISSKREDLQTYNDLLNTIAGTSLGFSIDVNQYNYSFGFRNLGAAGNIISFSINRYFDN